MEHNILDFVEVSEGGSDNSSSQIRPELETMMEYTHSLTKEFSPMRALEITITFKEHLLRMYKYEYLIILIRKYLLKHQVNCKAVLISDWSKTGRFHLHGIIEMRERKADKLKTIQNYLSRTFGRIMIRTVTYWDSYMDYIVGQYTPGHPKYRNDIPVFTKELIITNL